MLFSFPAYQTFYTGKQGYQAGIMFPVCREIRENRREQQELFKNSRLNGREGNNGDSGKAYQPEGTCGPVRGETVMGVCQNQKGHAHAQAGQTYPLSVGQGLELD
jgi:hypothetical protein